MLAATLITVGIGLGSSLLLGPAKPKGLTTNPSDRLFASLDPTTPRKIVFGSTAMATDVRYQAFTGSNQEYLEQIVVVASHEVNSIDEIWLDNEVAWTSGGGAQGRYVGYLTVTARTLGTNANGIAIDSTWTSSCTLTGCAYVHIKYKTTGSSKKTDSPFSGGITSRMTIRGKGAKVYDPRLDSTVSGGSGSHRADDQTTWAWDADASRNPAIQELWYELGWKIGGKLAIGKGVPKSRLNLASYGVAANVCDESVSLSGGGTEKRYRSDGVISESDSPGAVRDTLCATMNGVLRDAGGKLALTAITNDLGSPVAPSGASAFDEDDVLGEIRWDQTPDLSDTFNIVRGRRVDPSDSALYQLTEYPAVSIANLDGIDRIDTFDLPMVQSNGQAQRLAKLRLKRNQYQGRLQFTGGPAFWALSLGDPFPVTHSAFGWTAKLFRCAGHSMSRGGDVRIVAVEENTAIYAWSAEETAAVGAGTPVVFDPLNDPLVVGIGDAVPEAVELLSRGGLLENSYLDMEDTAGKPAGVYLVDQSGSTSRAANIAFFDSNKNALTLLDTGGSQFGAGFPAIPIDDRQQYTIIVRHKSSGAAGAGLYVRMNELAGALPTGKTHVGNTSSGTPDTVTANRTGLVDMVSDGPMPGTTYIETTYTYTPTSGTKFASFSLYNWGSTVNYTVDSVQVSPKLGPVVQYLDRTTGRATTSLLLGTATIAGGRSTNNVAMTSANVAGAATISIPSHSRKAPGASAAEARTFNSGSIAGKAFSTFYYVYCDDAGFAGGAVTYAATTNPDDLVANVNRVIVGSLTTCNSGGTGGTGGGGLDGPIG